MQVTPAAHPTYGDFTLFVCAPGIVEYATETATHKAVEVSQRAMQV